MSKYKPPILHRRLGRCDVCGRPTHIKDLVIQNQEGLALEGENKFLYSAYDSTKWSCTATDGGATSYGPYCGLYMNTPGLSSTTVEQPTLLGGVQTWSGNGVLRTITTATSASGDTNICISAMAGVKQDETAADITIVMGLCNSGYTVLEPQKTWTFTGGHKRIWFTVPVASLLSLSSSALFAYFDVTCSGEWWICEMQWEDATKPGTFIETSGTAVTNTADSRKYSAHKVCKRCRKPKWDLTKGTTAVEQPDRWQPWDL